MAFTISATLDYRFAEPCEVLRLVEAARTPDQVIQGESLIITPGVNISRLDDSVTGERRAVFTAMGDHRISYSVRVDVLARDADLTDAPQAAIRDLPPEAVRYLRASRYCPSDRFEAFSQRQFGDLRGGERVTAILAWIAREIDYRAGISDAGTTALDTFLDRAGVCRDFAHLAISLARAADIPARAVSAYAWKLEPPDLHAVAEVYLGGRWRLIDPTGRAPIDGLVRVATGLDAADIAFMTIFGRGEMLAQSFAIEALRPPPSAADVREVA